MEQREKEVFNSIIINQVNNPTVVLKLLSLLHINQA